MRRQTRDWRPVTAVVALTGVFLLSFTIVYRTSTNNVARVENWAQNHGYEARYVTRWYIASPFWLWRRKGDDIFQALLMREGNSRLSYFRVSWWAVAQRWEDGTTADE